MSKYVKDRDERGDKEVVLIIPEEDREDITDMVKGDGFHLLRNFWKADI